VVLLDTCALLWWTLEPESLSPRAREACDRIVIDGGFISSISVWEAGIKARRGALELGTTLEDYVARLRKLSSPEIVALDEDIWVKNLSLPWDHRDPADRTIVATAFLKDLPIVTKDEVIGRFYPKVIW
jgi:PIN domain nuclease of toxin-antitoxin system